ncbi:MAG: LamG domain-containing protein, partial [Planctomycetota bacterium]
MSKKLIFLISFIFMLGMVSPGMGQDDPSLMGWWSFDGHTNDVSGNGRHGTINGDPSFLVGVFGLALEFDGDDYVTIEGYKGVLGTNPLSIACWIKTTNTATQQIIHYGTDIGGQRIEFRIQSDEFRLSNGNGNARSTTAVTDGEWHHVVVTLPENSLIDDARFYLDGEPDTLTRSDADSWFDVVADWDVTIGYRLARNDRPFIGSIDEVAIYDKVLTQEEVLQIMGTGGEPYPYALLPDPVDGALVEDTWVGLSWLPGTLATSHDLYFGESLDDVNDGTNNTFVDNYAEASVILGIINHPFPGGLVPGTTYYWRIDEVNDAEPNSPWKGDVWSFTIPPKTAYNLYPIDGAKYIDPNVTLGWAGGLAVKLHHIYFGDNFDDVNDGTNETYKGPLPNPTYTPGTLEVDKAYYWRVDEYDGDVTNKGDVISFTTMPVIDITDPNLIGWWKFNAGIGDIAPDFSGHGNHGLIINPNWLSPGWIGDSALGFGSGSYMAIRNLVLNEPNQAEVSVSAWIRTSESGMQTIASFDRSDYWRLEAGDSQYA